VLAVRTTSRSGAAGAAGEDGAARADDAAELDAALQQLGHATVRARLPHLLTLFLRTMLLRVGARVCATCLLCHAMPCGVDAHASDARSSSLCALHMHRLTLTRLVTSSAAASSS
jgi:hypothetical protein